MILLVYTCMEVPVTLAFNVELSLSEVSGIVALAIDILLLCDILITFRTAYFDKWNRNVLVMDQWSVAKRYFCGWFLIDFVTSVPLEFMLPEDMGKNVKVVKVRLQIKTI